MYSDIIVKFIQRDTEELLQEEELTLRGAYFLAESEIEDKLARDVYLRFFCKTSGLELTHRFEYGSFVGFDKLSEIYSEDVTIH